SGRRAHGARPAGRAAGAGDRAALLRRARHRGDGGGPGALGCHGQARVGHGQGLAVPAAERRRAGGMTPADWQQARALLAGALGRPADQRAAWLDRRCGDDADLRQELEALLAAAETDGFLDGEPQPPASAIAVGEVLGPYKIERKLAEGGMG